MEAIISGLFMGAGGGRGWFRLVPHLHPRLVPPRKRLLHGRERLVPGGRCAQGQPHLGSDRGGVLRLLGVAVVELGWRRRHEAPPEVVGAQVQGRSAYGARAGRCVMTKRRGGRKAKSVSSWNRRLRAERTERAAEKSEANDWSKTAPRARAKGGVAEPGGPGRPWVGPEEAPDDPA